MDARWFDTNYWQQQQALLGGAPGRGTSCFISTPAGEAVLRHYHRGGLMARLNKDHYLWTGLTRTRAWQELHLTHQLHQLKLPVPQPLAARIQRSGLTYQADLLTLRLPDVQPLAEHLLAGNIQPQLLHSVGQTIRRFHAAGLNHVDLNPRNLLVQSASCQVWLIDFDRCFMQTPRPRPDHPNLQRLQRALHKLNSQQADEWFQTILQGYQQTVS